VSARRLVARCGRHRAGSLVRSDGRVLQPLVPVHRRGQRGLDRRDHVARLAIQDHGRRVSARQERGDDRDGSCRSLPARHGSRPMQACFTRTPYRPDTVREDRIHRPRRGSCGGRGPRHHAGADGGLRELATDLVPPGSRVVVPSRFGYLGSDMPDGATPEMQADAFAALLDARGVGRALVLAGSAGSTSALHFAIRHHDRTTALLLVSANVPGPHQSKGMPLRAVFRAIFGSDPVCGPGSRTCRASWRG